jgi:hypothetical protein
MIDPIASNPFHITRAYRLAAQQAPVVLRSSPVAAAHAASVQSGASRLVAGVVPGRIDFGGQQPAQVNGAIAMYRHPADRNTAATAVHAGRLLDRMA